MRVKHGTCPRIIQWGQRSEMATRPGGCPGRTWARVEAVFERAVSLPEDARADFVASETADNMHAREELLALIQSDSAVKDSPLSRAVGSALVDVIHDQRRALLGRIVGNYKLVAVLGEGGTGTVYLGERADHQYSARVAVKIVDQTALQGNFGERFKAERQILASLNHSNIARLLDAGETEDGHPYLVMEHVQGEPLDEYCDRRQLDVSQRLKLFVQICSAVQYAHQNLIVHRDLKPANILVSEDGTPKLLDFGIAKLLQAPGTSRTTDMTRLTDRLLTPEYASPEQILGSNIMTASDVYSLGVVLYQLVCGMRPYKVPVSASQLELERSICIADPERPSIALRRANTSEYPIEAIATARATTPEKLARQLTGDLDSIILKAMRKEPQHRYGSIEQFATDILHHLSHEPVGARQGNWLYYSQRFARRHTMGVAAGSAFVMFVIGVAVVMSIQRQEIARALDRATQQGQRAEMVSEFMLDVFGAADPYVHFGREPTASALLDQAALRIQTDLDQQPLVRARLLEAIGRSYRNMRQPNRAIPYLEESLALQRQTSPEELRIASILAELSMAQQEAGQIQASNSTLGQAIGLISASPATHSETHGKLLVQLGRLEMVRGNTGEAEKQLRSALLLMANLKGSGDPEVAGILVDLASVLMWQNDLTKAEETARKAAHIYSTVPDSHPDRITADSLLAQILLYRNQIGEASKLFERVLLAQKFVYGPNSAPTAATLGHLAQVRVAQGDFKRAESVLREALQIHLDANSTAAHTVGYLQTVLGTVLVKQHRYEEAETTLKDTLELLNRSLPPDHQYVASAEYYLGEALLGGGKFNDAEAVLTASMNRWKRNDGPAFRIARSKSALGEALVRQGRIKEGEQYLIETFRQLIADESADKEAKDRAQARLERFYLDRGQRAKFDLLMQEQSARVAGNR